MASDHSTSWKMDGERLTDFFFFGGGPSKITADGDCSHEIKDAWFLEESYDQSRQCIQKQRHYFPNKGPSSQAPVFPVVMYGCENWTVKKAEPRRIGAFELRCWRGLLRVPWTARRSNQSILKEISPEYAVLNKDGCWSWNSNTLATWCKELTHWKRPWCWVRLKVGGEADNRGWDGWIASLARWTGVWVNSGSWWWTGRPGMLQCMGSQRVELDYWTEPNMVGPVWSARERVLNKEFTFRGQDRYWTFNKHGYPGSIPGMLGKPEKAADPRKAKQRLG